MERDRAAASSTQTQQKGLNVVYWILLSAVGAVLVFLGIRYRPRISLPPAPVILEKFFVRAGIRPPAIVQLWARRAMLPPLARAYLEINQALGRLDRQPAATDTPTERAELLAQELPAVRKPAYRLVNEYQVEMFSNQPANLTVAIKSAIEIKDRSLQAYFKRMFSRFQRPLKGTPKKR